MNKWEEVAKLFNLELEEEFNVKTISGVLLELKFTYTFGLLKKDGTSWVVINGQLGNLINGNWEVIQKPWKPKVGENYWFYSYTYGAEQTKWVKSSEWDLTFYKLGNCFKTKEEAETKGKELMEQIRKEYEDE